MSSGTIASASQTTWGKSAGTVAARRSEPRRCRRPENTGCLVMVTLMSS
jgi:hypothetical protein